MPSFAPALETTLHKALEAASSRRHEYATLEHLLLALVDDEHASKVMDPCSVDLGDLKATVTHYLDTQLEALRVDQTTDPSPTSGLQRVVPHPIWPVQSPGRAEVTDDNVRVALLPAPERQSVNVHQQRETHHTHAEQFTN